MQSLWKYLVSENPMSLEAVRAGRRFLRTGGETGRAVNYTILAIIGFIYLWLLLAILRYRENMIIELQVIQLVILTLVVPGSLYGAVSGEREKLTWDSLIMTRLTPVQIIAGKLLWRCLLIVGIMTLFTIPILLCRYANGMLCSGDGCRMSFSDDWGKSFASIVQVQVLTFVWSLLLAAVAFFASSKSRRPITTLSVVTVALLSFLALIPMLVAMFGGQPEWRYSDFSPLSVLGSFLIQINPFYNLLVVSGPQTYANTTPDVFRDLGFQNVLPVFYAIGAGVLLNGTYRALRSLEAPRRTIG